MPFAIVHVNFVECLHVIWEITQIKLYEVIKINYDKSFGNNSLLQL